VVKAVPVRFKAMAKAMADATSAIAYIQTYNLLLSTLLLVMNLMYKTYTISKEVYKG